MKSGDDAVALYHIVYKHEGFEESAQNLFKLVQQAEGQRPGKNRKLFLDIEGHRIEEGGFDADMLELQKEFLLGFLLVETIKNPHLSIEDLALKLKDNDCNVTPDSIRNLFTYHGLTVKKTPGTPF